MNGEPILFDQHLKDEYVELVCRRTNLMYRAPNSPEHIGIQLSPEIRDIERNLLDHPLTNIHMQCAILARVAWMEAMLYGIADPDLKHRMLLSLREHYREIQRLPKAWRDAFAPIWAMWMDNLEWEENHANDAA
jgi:hypothetical protein